MKSFRLQTVLDYRKRLEDEAHKSLSFSLEEERYCVLEKEQREHELGQLRVELQEVKTQEVILSLVMLYEQCILCKKREIEACEQKVASVKAKIEKKKQMLVQARQEKRVLEIIKEKREDAERKKRRHQENVFLDEIAVLGFGERK